VNRPRAADDFASIRARMEELRREREEGSHTAEGEVERDQAIRRARNVRWPPSETITAPGGVRQSGPTRR
jgi:hypothetical protein